MDIKCDEANVSTAALWLIQFKISICLLSINLCMNEVYIAGPKNLFFFSFFLIWFISNNNNIKTLKTRQTAKF